MSDEHIRLVEAVNNAQTREEHDRAIAYLEGWRAGVRYAGMRPDLLGCDAHYLHQGIDRPMCCGVWLDWVPGGAPDERDPVGDLLRVSRLALLARL